jgi:nucleoside-diphosphate-sugar epimerase
MTKQKQKRVWNVLVTGGAGYVGSVLVPKLLAEGHRVAVLDLCIYGDDVFEEFKEHPRLRQIKGDLRDPECVREALWGCNAVIHLACISNDPSFELNPELGKSINYDSFRPLVLAAKAGGVERFIYASSSSVYGIKNDLEVTEDLVLEPLTDYSKFKAMCEEVLAEERAPGFVTCTLRPATVCGYAPRQRLDVVVNILTNQAFNTRRIKVMGGAQKRPNIHVQDMADLYVFLLQQPDEAIDGEIYNAGYENHTLDQLAEMVRRQVGNDIVVDVVPTNDMRSYHVSSEKMRRKLGFMPKHTIEDAIRDLVAAFRAGKLPNSLDDSRYFNIRRMQELSLK